MISRAHGLGSITMSTWPNSTGWLSPTRISFTVPQTPAGPGADHPEAVRVQAFDPQRNDVVGKEVERNDVPAAYQRPEPGVRRALVHESHALPGVLLEVATEKFNGTGGRRNQVQNHPDSSAFSGPIWTQKTEDITPADF